MVKIIKTESIVLVARDWGSREWRVIVLLFNGYRVSVLQDEKL